MDPLQPINPEQPSSVLATTSAPARKRTPRSIDQVRSTAILRATLAVIAESGYDGMTVDEVAKRAGVSKATMYRRWSSREDLVVDAVRSMNPGVEFPDTGSLRGDLVAGVSAFLDSDDNIRVVVGIASALPRHPELRQALSDFLRQQTDKSYLEVYRRAAERGEIVDDRHAVRLTAVLRGVLINELLFAQGAVDRDFLVDLVDELILPFATGRHTPAS